MSERRTFPIPRELLVLLIGCGLLAATFVVGRLVADQRQFLLLGAFAAFPMLVASFRYFDQVVLIIPFAAIYVPFSLPTGSDSRVSAVMLLVTMLCGVWTLTVIVTRRARLLRSPLNAVLACFVVVACAAFLWSIVFRDPLLIRYDKFTIVQLAALLSIILSPAAALLIANFAATPRALWWIAGLFVLAGVLQIVMFVAHIDLNAPNTRGLFSLWFVSVIYSILLVHHRLTRVWRAMLLGLLLLYLYIVGIVGIAWLSGWVPPLAAILAITLFRSRLWFLALLLVLVVVVVTNQAWIDKHVLEEAESDGSYERLTLWELNFELLRDHPVLGTGPAGYALYYVTYHPDEARSTHNNYLDIAAQTGLLGSLCWVWLIVAGIREARAALRHAPPGIMRTLAFACSGGLVGALAAMALGDWILPFAYNQGIEGYRYTVYSWIFLGILMSIRHQVAARPSPARKETGHVEYNARRLGHSG